jgi:hypothetical protein
LCVDQVNLIDNIEGGLSENTECRRNKVELQLILLDATIFKKLLLLTVMARSMVLVNLVKNKMNILSMGG